eukprot:TRINITY_DN74622_c0_g1_i1.p1 TRINITY_DN74622_c0_g1~~TRINITY_DN74622_c0_g1_i1.p1  ORF type:complete len:437 (+),score=75.56 TRINITY_DN74622_c0_g1_i1:71-1381(+)
MVAAASVLLRLGLAALVSSPFERVHGLHVNGLIGYAWEASGGRSGVSLAGLFNGTQPVKKLDLPVQNAVKTYDPAHQGVTPQQAAESRRYLIASFPDMKQVAYCHLPDNVWRPLVMGIIAEPRGVAVDAASARLYVADAALGKIFWYQLSVRSDGLLKTDNQQYLAVDGFVAKWLAVNGVGDLYFTGKAIVQAPATSYDAVYRQDGVNIVKGRATAVAPMEVYSRANTGMPASKVWMPSGIGVDTFSIYWGNQESGSTHGSVVKAPRLNIASVQGVPSSPAGAITLDSRFEEVRGLMVTTTNIYFLTPAGVYGVPKSSANTVDDPTAGLVASLPADDVNLAAFDPKSIAWDGDGTAYVTDITAGVVYAFPAMDLENHQFTKFVDAPGVHGVTVANFDSYLSGNPEAAPEALRSTAAGLLPLQCLLMIGAAWLARVA